jgi:alpha-tubulin suppressor-like RCC1 family protein
VVAWGDSGYGQLPAPEELDEVSSVAAGLYHSLALKVDGTVVGWGYNGAGQTNVPIGLSGVKAIAAGHHSMALKSDGTVVVWGSAYEVPSGLSEVSAIGAGRFHSLALKTNGTVVAWGRNVEGQTNVPLGLRDVIAIAAGGYHSVALRSDGTVVAWGYNVSGQATVPTDLTGVTAIYAGDYHTVALISLGFDPADLDSDGVPYLLEQAFGLDANVPDQNSLPLPDLENGSLTLTITKHAGVTYEVQTAGTLNENASDSFSAATTTIIIDNAATLKVRDNFILNSNSNRYMRTKVSELP